VLDEVFKGLRMAPGSVCMIACQYLKNWGIHVNEDNQEFIEGKSLDGYRRQWRSSSSLTHQMINNASSKAGITYNNNQLNQMLASMVMGVIEEMAKVVLGRRIRILDIGAGDGKTTIAVLDQMKSMGQEQLAGCCKFILLDPSPTALAAAYTRIGDRGVVLPIGGTLEDYFEEDPRPLDMIISNAVFHHFSFPTFLGKINEKLVDDGVMIVGDWHTTIWSQPAFIVPILRMLNAEESKIRLFEMTFNVKKGDLEGHERELTPMQRESNRRMLEYEKYLSEELKGTEQASPLLLFEAHESLDDRMAKYREKGFVTDLEELKKKRWCSSIKSNVRTPKSKYELGAVAMVSK
jgi:2-polyprenyl-3-methyl-5-hydroxy-6-metoxy-1,4-benzoquinol methylase